MAFRASPLAITAVAGLLCALAMAGPAQGAPTRARLVHCGGGTCLRLSGHRPRTEVAIRVEGRELHVQGQRAWQATVPLSTARSWSIGRGYSVAVTLVDVQAGTEHRELVALPPGSLGSRLDLASLVVHSR